MKGLTDEPPMKTITHPQARPPLRPWTGTTGLLALMAMGAFLRTPAWAGDMYTHAPQAGGIPAQSMMTSITVTETNATLCWYGLRGWYSIETATNLAGPWTSVGRCEATDYTWCQTVSNINGPSALFRLNQNNA